MGETRTMQKSEFREQKPELSERERLRNARRGTMNERGMLRLGLWSLVPMKGDSMKGTRNPNDEARMTRCPTGASKATCRRSCAVVGPDRGGCPQQLRADDLRRTAPRQRVHKLDDLKRQALGPLLELLRIHFSPPSDPQSSTWNLQSRMEWARSGSNGRPADYESAALTN